MRIKNYISLPSNTLFLLLLLGSPVMIVRAQEQVNFPKEYRISAEFFPQDASVYGYPVSPENFMRAQTTVKYETPPDQKVFFSLHGELFVDSIKAGNARLPFSCEKVFYELDYSSVALKVTLDSIFHGNELTIYYKGFFNPSRGRSLSDFMRIDNKEGVFLRSYGYSLWFPVFITPEMPWYNIHVSQVKIITPATFHTVVTGRKVSEHTEGVKTISIWVPGTVSLLDMQCLSGDYLIASRANVSLYYFRDTESVSSAAKILSFVQNLENLYHQYLKKVDDSDTLYLVETPKYGDLSGNNVIGIQQDRFRTFNNIWTKLTIAHEMIHPYVQLPLSTKNPLYAFVWEGFPSFFMIWAAARTLDPSEFDLPAFMKNVQQEYLRKRKEGTDRRGNKLPEEKPITQITAHDIGKYKDTFVLSDRVWLFFYYIWNKMGNQQFDSFLSTLFSQQDLDYPLFKKIIEKYLPGSGEDINVWLTTTSFPPRFLIDYNP